MLQRPKKGSVDFLALYQGTREVPGVEGAKPGVAPVGTGIVTGAEFAGVEVGIVYDGASAVDDFEMRLQALRLAEAKRVGALRKDAGGEEMRGLAPMLFGAVDTPEGLAEWKVVVADVLRALIVEVRGVEGGPLKGDDVGEFFLEQLTLGERLRLAFVALGAQGPNRRHYFSPAAASNRKARRSARSRSR